MCIQVLRSKKKRPFFQAVGRRLSTAEVLGSTWAPLDQLQSTFDEVLVRLGYRCNEDGEAQQKLPPNKTWENDGKWECVALKIGTQPKKMGIPGGGATIFTLPNQALALPWTHSAIASQSRGRTATATFFGRSVT